jgi:hexulose-6-phosphate isomerase
MKAFAADGVPGAAGELKKAFCFSMLPGDMSVEDRFKLAKDIGLDGVEVPPLDNADDILKFRAASDATGVRMHSIIYGGWKAPIASADPAVAEQGVALIEAQLGVAKQIGADSVLVVPGVVDANNRYADVYQRSQAQLKKLAPKAEAAGVSILIENVWNNFLLSPLEFARYLDEIGSPRVQAYFDVGNVVAFGWPEDWIRTLGPRIKKIHLKDFKRDGRQWVNLREGSVDWPEVRKAMREVGYQSYLTAELKGGDEAYLRDVSARIGMIISEKA